MGNSRRVSKTILKKLQATWPGVRSLAGTKERISASRELTPKVVLWSTWTSWPTYPALTPQTPFEIRPHCHIHQDSWPDLGFLSSPSVSLRIAGLRQAYATVSGLMWKTHTAVFHVYPLSHLPGPGALVAIISLNIFHPRWFAYMHGCGTSSATTPSLGHCALSVKCLVPVWSLQDSSGCSWGSH